MTWFKVMVLILNSILLVSLTVYSFQCKSLFIWKQ